jgi:hypothetical protein
LPFDVTPGKNKEHFLSVEKYIITFFSPVVQKCCEKYAASREQLAFSPAWSWHNVAAGSLQLEDLTGLITILDFFTYCCINCMHILPFLGTVKVRMESGNICINAALLC